MANLFAVLAEGSSLTGSAVLRCRRIFGELPWILIGEKKGYISAALFKIGSTSWIRTKDPMINSHLLYQLS
jgi:hypothetical protein